MAETWCPNCARPVTPITVTPLRAWIIGALGCLGSFVALFIVVFVIGVVVLSARHATGDDAETLAYAITRAVFNWFVLAALILSGLLVFFQRRRVCPVCRRTIRSPRSGGSSG